MTELKQKVNDGSSLNIFEKLRYRTTYEELIDELKNIGEVAIIDSNEVRRVREKKLEDIFARLGQNPSEGVLSYNYLYINKQFYGGYAVNSDGVKYKIDIEKISQGLLDEDLTIVDPYEDIIKDVNKFNEVQERVKTNPKDEDALFQYCSLRYYYLDDKDSILKIYGKILELNPQSVLVHHYGGNLLYKEGELYNQAYLLFEKGLNMRSIDGDRFHGRFHFDLSDISRCFKELESLKVIGFPIDKLKFKYNKKRGFYLPGFDYKTFAIRDYPFTDNAVKYFSQLHYDIALDTEQREGTKHTADNCPYLLYLN